LGGGSTAPGASVTGGVVNATGEGTVNVIASITSGITIGTPFVLPFTINFSAPPTAPQNFTATAGDTEVALSWTAPTSDGGSAITGYEVSSDNGATWVAADSNTDHTFTGLTNGTAYIFRVRAVNIAGVGAEASETATPVAVIDIFVKEGVTPPALGAAPVTAITPTAQFTGTVEWEHSGGTAAGAAFGAERVYTATITLIPETGFTLQGVAADFFDVAGADTVTNPANSGVITAVFPATAALTNAQVPTITAQPISHTVSTNTAVTLTVAANVTDGGDLSFQWFSNTTNSNTEGTAIAGATSATFMTSTSAAGTGWYYVVITNTNTGVTGSQTAAATSVVVSVTAQIPPTGGGSGNWGGSDGWWRPTERETAQTVELPPEPAAIYGYYDEQSPDVPQFPFIDVAATDWFYPFVRAVWENQLFYGTSHNTFTPQGSMTRAMFVQVFANMEGVDLTLYQANAANPRFNDVSPTAWYFAAIEWAAGQGLVSGLDDGRFEPSRAVTRQEMALLLNNYIVSRGITLPQGATSIFTDQDSISDWAVEGVLAIQAVGLITGYPDGSFNPQGTATRAEVATIFARFAEAANLPRRSNLTEDETEE